MSPGPHTGPPQNRETSTPSCWLKMQLEEPRQQLLPEWGVCGSPRGSRCSNRSPCPQAHSGASTAATRSKPPKVHQQTNGKQSVGHRHKAMGRGPTMEGAGPMLRGVDAGPPAATREAAQMILRPTPQTRMFITGTTTRVES